MLQEAFRSLGWNAVVRGLHDRAAQEARKYFEEKLADSWGDERRRLADLIDRLHRQRVSGAEVGVLEHWLGSLNHWTVCLDAVGFLSVNGAIRRGLP